MGAVCPVYSQMDQLKILHMHTQTPHTDVSLVCKAIISKFRQLGDLVGGYFGVSYTVFTTLKFGITLNYLKNHDIMISY